MSIEQPNPYLAPSASITHRETERRNLLTNIVIGVCVVLAAAMLVGQQIARVRFDGYGFVGDQLPFSTQMLLHPLAVCLPLFCVSLVAAARSWSNQWRIKVCILVMIFMFFFAGIFCLSMFVTDSAIRFGLGI